MSGVSRKIFWSEGLAEHPSVTDPQRRQKPACSVCPLDLNGPAEEASLPETYTSSGGHTAQPVTARVLSRVRLLATPGPAAHRAPLSVGCSRQEHWTGLPFPSPGELPDPGIEPTSLKSPASAGKFLATVPPGKPFRLKSPESEPGSPQSHARRVRQRRGKLASLGAPAPTGPPSSSLTAVPQQCREPLLPVSHALCVLPETLSPRPGLPPTPHRADLTRSPGCC